MEKKRLRRIIGIMVAFYVISAIIVSCQDDNNNNKKIDSLDNGNLKIWHYDLNLGKKIIKIFKSNNRDIDLELEIKKLDSLNLKEKITKLIKAGSNEIPDLVCLPNDFSTQNENMFINLDSKQNNLKSSNKNLYKYALEIVKDSNGKGKFICNSINPVAIAYKTDIARKYLGMINEAKAKTYFSDFTNIIETGKRLKEKSNNKCKLFTNTDDFMEMYLQNRDYKWIEKQKIVVDEKMIDFMGLTKRVEVLNLDSNIKYNSKDWRKAITDDTHFAFVVRFNDLERIKNLQGKNMKFAQRWGIVKPEMSFYKGGDLLGIVKNSKNQKLAGNFLEYITQNKDYLADYSLATNTFSSNKAIIQKLKSDETLISELTGENIYNSYTKAINDDYHNLFTKYDNKINKIFLSYINIYSKKTENYLEVLQRFKSEAYKVIKDKKVQQNKNKNKIKKNKN